MMQALRRAKGNGKISIVPYYRILFYFYLEKNKRLGKKFSIYNVYFAIKIFFFFEKFAIKILRSVKPAHWLALYDGFGSI